MKKLVKENINEPKSVQETLDEVISHLREVVYPSLDPDELIEFQQKLKSWIEYTLR